MQADSSWYLWIWAIESRERCMQLERFTFDGKWTKVEQAIISPRPCNVKQWARAIVAFFPILVTVAFCSVNMRAFGGSCVAICISGLCSAAWWFVALRLAYALLLLMAFQDKTHGNGHTPIQETINIMLNYLLQHYNSLVPICGISITCKAAPSSRPAPVFTIFNSQNEKCLSSCRSFPNHRHCHCIQLDENTECRWLGLWDDIGRTRNCNKCGWKWRQREHGL